MQRKPAVAGLFYPSEPDKLRDNVIELLSGGGLSGGDIDAFAVVSPHAGYIYSGRVAGKVFAHVRVKDRVVILCPNHTGYYTDVSVFPPGGEWIFPGFSVSIDDEVSSFLARRFQADTGAHMREHSAEVIVPFLYYKNPQVKISVVCIRTLDKDILFELGKALFDIRKEFDVLFVASSDMNHYEPDDISRNKDKKAIDRIVDIDPDGLIDIVFREDISMCGVAPVTALLFSAKLWGVKNAELIAYSNSGEVSGDFTSVVGYAGIIIK